MAYSIAGPANLLQDLRVGASDHGAGRRPIAEPDPQHVRVDRKLALWILHRPGQWNLVVPLTSDLEQCLDLTGRDDAGPPLVVLARILVTRQPLMLAIG